MIKKTILLTALIGLAGCNDDDNKIVVKPNPTYKEPNVIIIGHRGASALRPEHTLEAYQKAIDDGANFIEPDLVSTKDGVLVARHENEIGGTTNISTLTQFADRQKTKTIDGQQLKGWFTEDLSLNELNQVKARERIPDLRPGNVQYNDKFNVPTLDQIILLAEKHYTKTGKVIGLYIETKHPTYFQSVNLALEDNLLKTLAKYKYTREIAPIYIQSFEVNNLKYFKDQLALHKTLKNAKLIQLYDAKTTIPADYAAKGLKTTYADMATPTGLKEVAKYAQGVGPSKDYIIPFNTQTPTSFIKDAHAAKLKVHPYTFRPENNFLPNAFKCSAKAAEKCEAGSIKEMQLFFKAGVDGLFTDDPAIGRKAVQPYLK
ncbi:glycerophosphodiester phosphodiesterase [Acinetobacter gerneri]|uniref:glycerophosphodiester phosphodiesterase n=1 Tax=Acinetobacter gerneri TaxID=202952 RepID=A0AAW8JII5_9GAMM|nr:glycerophosphodiester phosphodiesterase [Acinetobacter gerneri]MDQ9010531.1 glycerophosphodiester phosphodiesterase [Acinetobacter gerneri]MDQ9014730.1 glycerophosphodiester phosphodiesterase [Acinetobacter gerneri]MDQ9025932.1 glycerophosphodiester phosphodiesterase [Acinetobacter gerneri]MDQ9053182.1 glycerophosphodiester phosphodiesterase [Acinetobacter gerneri]MDQ9060831.1 glycerophosphodiester phosphodiesterase [Acinetobacter gerneri]